jgi:serine/threonine protein kinase
MSTAVPRRLGDFEIVRELGRGGMGVVYEAVQVSLNRKVALKVLAGGLGLTPTAVQRFRREAEAAARLHHTNIVPVYATGEADGTHFYAMELIDGPSLDHVLRQLRDAGRPSPAPTKRPETDSAVPPELAATGAYVPESGPATTLCTTSLHSGGDYFDTVARLVADVADALDHAHRNGVIHRDVKPSNLLLASAGRLSVNDFGLARLLEQPGMTMTGEFVGTPAYMSPEQITAGRVPLDHRTDVYSLGATLYELLTLSPPFSGQTREQVLGQIVQKEPRAPRRIDRRVPVDLETICLKCLEKDPDRRYPTAGALAEDLRRYVNRFAIAARRAGPVQRLAKWARRHPGLSATSGCALVLALVAGILGYRLQVEEQQRRADQQQHERQLEEHERHRALDKATLAAISGEFEAADRAIDEAELLAASPGQVRILRGQVALERGDVKAAIQHLQQAVRLLPESVAARSLLARAYIDDGEWALYFQNLNELERLSPTTSEDYLFKGRLEAWDDPALALTNLEEAVRQRPGSGIARLARAETQAFYAQLTGKPEDAVLAVQYANTAKDMLPGNPKALAISLRAHLVAATAYGQNGRPDKCREELMQAGGDVKALGDVTAPGDVLWMRGIYFDYLGHEQPEAFLKVCRCSREKTSHQAVAYLCVSGLYRLGRFEEARDLIDQRLPQVVSKVDYLVLKGFVVAELANGQAEAQAVCETATKEAVAAPASIAGTWGPQLLLRLLGRKPQAEEACRQARARSMGRFPSRSEWIKRLLDYNCGDLNDQQLYQAAGASRLDKCEAHFHIAMTKLSEGDRRSASEHFRQCIATGVFLFYEYQWSRAFLARMEKDRTWPSWISEAK